MAFRSEPCDFHLPWVYSARVFGGGVHLEGGEVATLSHLSPFPRLCHVPPANFPSVFQLSLLISSLILP